MKSSPLGVCPPRGLRLGLRASSMLTLGWSNGIQSGVKKTVEEIGDLENAVCVDSAFELPNATVAAT